MNLLMHLRLKIARDIPIMFTCRPIVARKWHSKISIDTSANNVDPVLLSQLFARIRQGRGI